MHTKGIMGMVALIFGLVFSTSAFADQDHGTTKDMNGKAKTGVEHNEKSFLDHQERAARGNEAKGQGQNLLSANRLIGNNIENRKGEDLGDITNFFVDQKTGKVAFVVVATGGFLNMGEEHHLVPFRVLNVNEDNISLDMSKEKLSQAPRWEPGMTDRDFDRRTSEYFGVSPYWEE